MSSITENEINQESSIEGGLNYIFNETTITILIWFLAIYIVISTVLGNFSISNPAHSFVVRLLDSSLIFLITLYILFSYYNLSSEDRNEIFTYSFTSLRETLLTPGVSFLWSLLYIALLYGVVYLFQIPYNNIPNGTNFLIGILSVLLVIFAVLFILHEILGIRVVEALFDVLDKMFYGFKKEEDYDEEAEGKPEVFNVSNNLYSYEEAPYVCQALGGRLASYDEIEQSYQNGGEWCNYGWSADQLALFPTQKDTWRQLQSSEENKNNCGRPGINGGYFANPNIKFGVNCYGIKPKAKQSDLDMMDANKNRMVPKSKYQMMVDKKVEFWKENADKLMTINAFNKNEWSKH